MGPTDAAWQTEQPATGTFAAATIPAPHLTERCRYRSDWLGANARVEIYWAAPVGYDLNDAELSASTSGLGSALAPLTGFNLRSQTSSSAGNYTTTVPTHVLGRLLGLGAELEVSIRMTRYGWRSDSASIATNAGLIAGLGGSCRNLS